MVGQRVGYIRVSSIDQNVERQLDGIALDRTFTDKASGKDVHRPQLEAMVGFVRDGDTMVVHHGLPRPQPRRPMRDHLRAGASSAGPSDDSSGPPHAPTGASVWLPSARINAGGVLQIPRSRACWGNPLRGAALRCSDRVPVVAPLYGRRHQSLCGAAVGATTERSRCSAGNKVPTLQQPGPWAGKPLRSPVAP